MALIKQELDVWLDGVSYAELNSTKYVPSAFALNFMNFIKLVNGAEGESHITPPVHLKMLDKLLEPSEKVANLVFRGAAKTTLFMEYFTLYIAMFGYIPNFGKVEGMIYVSDSMENGVKSARKNIESRYNRSDFCKKWIPKFHPTDPYLEFENTEGHRFGVKMFGAKTGLRGTKIFGKRPTIAVLDDLIADDDATSKAAMIAINDTVSKGVNFALDPVRRKTIFNGTPFNKEDILIKAVESGAWDVNVWPVCERFPCTKAEFVGAWPDRFSYDFVKQQYDDAVLEGKLSGFFQELMLRISSDEERLVQDAEIRWFNRADLLKNKQNFNFYITTDFAYSTKESADDSVISVWAYNAQGDWFWVDGMCERQTIDKTFTKLFQLVQKYQPQSVGIEVSAQQRGYIDLLRDWMMRLNIWFNFASSEKSGEAGIRPLTDKLSRFNLVVPFFKAGKMYFPKEMNASIIMSKFMGQIRLTTQDGIKGRDDCLDTISMLGYLKPWKPTETVDPMLGHNGGPEWDDGTWAEEQSNPMSSYIV